MNMRSSVWVFVSCLLFAACAGPRAGTDTRPDGPDGTGDQGVRLSEYEDFDPSSYEEEPPAETELQHDVPAHLMTGRPPETATRTVSGFRVQIAQTQDKFAADRAVEEALAWWREEAQRPNAPALFSQAPPPVYTLYLQPYYRVRLGNFTSREEAARFIETVRARFSSALVVPDMVLVR
jgi:hypothetical protein